jgi:hypothetical protein
MISMSFMRIIAAWKGEKQTNCHNNFGYYCLKIPIRTALFVENIGVRDTLKGKLVYT